MKSHDWIFLMFTTIICCTTIITIAQAQQRGRVKFGVSMQKDEAETNDSPEIVNQAPRGSAPQRASSRFRVANPSAIPSTIEENKESLRRGNRGRANDRSSRKLTAEATEVIPLVRSRKRISPAVAPSSDEPTKIELPTSGIDRTNIIRRSKTRSDSPASSSSTSSPPASGSSMRRRSDVSSEGPIESVRKVRTFTSRSVTKQADEVISSENPLTVATTSSNWRNVAINRGASKVKSSERKPKALEEDQLEDENYPEHFKLLLRKQQPSPALLPKNYPKIPIQEDPTYSKFNEIYEIPRAQGRLRRIEQTSQETSDEILQVSRAIPKVRRVELKREDTARAALKTKRIEPRTEEKLESAVKIEEPTKSRRSDSEKLRAQVKINKATIKSRKRDPSNEVKREDIPKVPFKSNRRTVSSTEDNVPEVKPNEIEESTKASKPLFLPRRAEPYRPKPKTTTQRPTTTSKPIKKPEVLETRSKFKNRLNSRLQFPSLRTKTSSTSDEVIKYDNEVVHTSPAPQPVRPLQITKSRNLAFDKPVVDARSKPKQQKFSSRYRGDAFSRYQQKTEPSKPIYTPTIPALTTEPIPRQLDQVTPYNLENQDLNKSGSNFEGIVYDGVVGVWNMVEPVAGGLTRSEISVESGGNEQPLAQSSVTVSIFEALADILSKTPSTTTTTTTTTSTTTSTTELPDIIQVPVQENDSISSTTVNTHDSITDVMVDENTTNTNEITNNDRDGRLLNSVDINPSTTIITPTTTLFLDSISDSSKTITVPQYTSDTTLLFRSQTEQTTPEFIDLTTISLPASQTPPTLTNTNLTNISTNLLELTTLASNPPTSLPMPFLADALTTPGSSLITTPQLISAISNFLDTSVQNASETMATTTENTTKTTTTATTLDTNSTPTDASTTLSPPITTTFSPPSTGSPPVTISFLDLFTIQAKKVNQNTEAAVEVHPVYKGPESTTIPVVGVAKKQTTGRPVNINTFFGTQTYPSISVTGSTSTGRTMELSSTFSEIPKVTGGVTTETAIPFTSTLEQDTSTLDYTTSPQSSIRTQSLPIHLNSILGSTQKYDQTSPFKTVQTETTTTIRSRFGNKRIPILPAGSVQSTTNKILTSTQTSPSTSTPVSTTTVTQVSPENNQQQLSNVTTTTSSTTTTTEQKPIQDFSIYGILPNNTVIRKRPPQVSRQLDIGIMVYGILPNQTVVRKYPNGTLMIVDSSKDVEVVDIDPKMLFNPFSELYRTSQSSLLLTTHRSTTSHRLIESNHILSSSSSSSSSTEVPNNFATGSGRRGNSIKDTTESGNTDSTLTTNTDDENLIQWLSENEDNILNSTILVESNTENAVLLDLLKRKYIKPDLPSRSSNVVSLTTVRNSIQENSIQPNKQEDVSENTLFDSSEEQKKDSVDDFLLSKGSVVPNRINNNNDDENVISKQFDTSYANVGIGSIFAGNKGRQFHISQRTKLYPIKYEMGIPNTTTKLFPIHTFSSSTMHKANHAVQKEFLAEVVNRTHGSVVESPIEGFEMATPKRNGESKFIDFGILESEVDSEANGDYFMDPEDRLKISDEGFDFDTDEGSGNSHNDDVEGGELKDDYRTKSVLDEHKTDFVDMKISQNSDTNINDILTGGKIDSEALNVDSATVTILSDSENGNIESPFVHIVFPEGVLESSEKFSDIYTTVSPFRNASLLLKSEDLIPSLNGKKNHKTNHNNNFGNMYFSDNLTTLRPNIDQVTGDNENLLHNSTISTSYVKDDELGIDFSNLPRVIKNNSMHFENSSKFANIASDNKNVTLSLLEDGNLGLKNETLHHSISDSYRNVISTNGSQYEMKSGGFFDSNSKISDDLDSTHSYVFFNTPTNHTFNNFATVNSTDGIDVVEHSEEENSGTSLNSNNIYESEMSSSNFLNSSNKTSEVQASDVEPYQVDSLNTSANRTDNISDKNYQTQLSVSEAPSTVSNGLNSSNNFVENLNKNGPKNMSPETSDVGFDQGDSFFSSLNSTNNISKNYFQNNHTNTSNNSAMTSNESFKRILPQGISSEILTSNTDSKTLEGNSHSNSQMDSEAISPGSVSSFTQNDSSNVVYSHNYHSEVLKPEIGSNSIERNYSKISTNTESFKDSSININLKPEIIPSFTTSEPLTQTSNISMFSVEIPMSSSKTPTLYKPDSVTESQNITTEHLASSKTKVIESSNNEFNLFSQDLQSSGKSSETLSSTTESSLEVSNELSPKDHIENKSEGFSSIHKDVDSQTINVVSKANSTEATDNLSEFTKSPVDSKVFQAEKPIVENSVRSITNIDSIPSNSLHFPPSQEQGLSQKMNVSFSDLKKSTVLLDEKLSSINERNKPDNLAPELKNNFTRYSSVGLSIDEVESIKPFFDVDQKNMLNFTELESDSSLFGTSSSTDSSIGQSTEELSALNGAVIYSQDSIMKTDSISHILGNESLVKDFIDRTKIVNGTFTKSEFSIGSNLSEHFTSKESSTESNKSIDRNRQPSISNVEEISSKQTDSIRNSQTVITYIPFEVTELNDIRSTSPADNTYSIELNVSEDIRDNLSTLDTQQNKNETGIDNETPENSGQPDISKIPLLDSVVSDKSSSVQTTLESNKYNEHTNTPPLSIAEEDYSNKVDSIRNIQTDNPDNFVTLSTPLEVTELNNILSTSTSDITSDIEFKVSEKLGDEFYLTTSDSKQNENEAANSNPGFSETLASNNNHPSPVSEIVKEFDQLGIKEVEDKYSASNTSDTSYNTLSVDDFFQQFEEQEILRPDTPLETNVKQLQESKSENNSSGKIDTDNKTSIAYVIEGKITSIPVIHIQNESELLESSNLDSSNESYSFPDLKDENQLEKIGLNSKQSDVTGRYQFDIKSDVTSPKMEDVTSNLPELSSDKEVIHQKNFKIAGEEIRISPEKTTTNTFDGSQNNFEPSRKSELLTFPGKVQVEIVQKDKPESMFVEVSDQQFSPNANNASIDQNFVKSKHILVPTTPYRDLVFENNTQQADSNNTSSKEVWTSSISSKIIEKGSSYESRLNESLPNYFSKANSYLKPNLDHSVGSNESRVFSPQSPLESAVIVLSTENLTNPYTSESVTEKVLNSKPSITPSTENNISNSNSQIGVSPFLLQKTSISSNEGNNSLPAYIESQFDSVFKISQKLTKPQDSYLSITSEEPTNITNDMSQPISLEPIVQILNTSFSNGRTDKDLETDQHVVPRKGVVLNSTEELENVVPIGLSEIMNSNTKNILENVAPYKNSEEIFHPGLPSHSGLNQSFLLQNTSREQSKEALYSYNQIKEDVIETYTSQDKELQVFQISSTETMMSLSTTQEPNLEQSVQEERNLKPSENTLQEVQAERYPAELSKPTITQLDNLSIKSTGKNELISSFDNASEQKAQYSTPIPIHENVDQVLKEQFETSSVRPVTSKADRDRVSKIILELLYKSEQDGLNISDNTISSKNFSNTSRDLLSKKSLQDFADSFKNNLNITKNSLVVSSTPSVDSPVTNSYEKVTRPPAVFYPVNSPKSVIPSSEPKAAIIMPTNMHAILDTSIKPDQVSMIFPKDAMPKLNMALPGNLHQIYTNERLHKPLLGLIPSNKQNLHEELLPKLKSNQLKSPKEREFNIPLKPIYPPSYFEESSSTTVASLETKGVVETTTPTLTRDEVQEIPHFVPEGVSIEIMSNTDSLILPSRSSKQANHKTVQSVESKFVPGGVPRDLLESIRTLPKENIQVGPVFNADTPLGEVFAHFPSNNVVPVFKASSTTPAPLKATDNVFHKTYQFNLKVLKSTIEKVENDVKVLKETFIKSLNNSTNLVDPPEKQIHNLHESSNFSKTSQDSPYKSSDFKGFKSESLTKDNIAPLDQLDLLQETLDPALATRSISNSPQNLVENSEFNLQTMMKNSEFRPSNSNPVYQMSANALANAQTINKFMSQSTDDSMSKYNAHPMTNSPESKMVSNINSGQNLYKTIPFSETPQQLPSEINGESWTKLTPSEVTYSPVQNIEAYNQKHTETQYTIQQENMYQESSTISSLGNSFIIDNLKNSINTITEPKQVDRKTTPTIYVVTPANMRTTTEIPTTPSSTTPTTTTPTSTTTTTTTTTTPSTTTTSSTTQSTTTSTTTPIPTTTTTTTTSTTTTTPIPVTLETTTTPRPTIVFKAPSKSQSSPQTNTALIGANSELEKNIKLLEQLLKLQASLKPKSSSSSTTTTSTTPSTTTTSKTTEAPTKITATSNADDEQFINQLRQLLLSQQQAAQKSTTSTTTTPKPTTTTTTTTRAPITISPQNLQDLLNSFSTPSFTSTTTARPITNANDIEFLNSLREIGKIQVTTSAPTTFANRIIELALKNRPVKPTSPVYISTTVPPFVPLPDFKLPQILPSNEVEKHNQDQASLSADLTLLSTLLGRRITIADLPQITKQFGGNRVKTAPAPVPAPIPRKTTTTTTTPRTTRTTTTTTDRPMTRNEIAEIEKNLNLLSSLLGRRVSINELPLIMQELRAGRKPKGTASGATINFITPAPFKTTTTVGPNPRPSLQSQTPISQEEVIELLKDPSLGSPEQLNIYGQSNDAILAAVLKQRGIGPAHNNLPINHLFGEEQTQKPYRPTRPPPPPPPPQRRPVLDGLAWLWRTWQDTAAPGNRVSKNNRQPTASASTRLESPLLVGAFGDDAPSPTVNSNAGGDYADLQYPQNPSFGQGNGLLTAAFGVTRAVSQFLGAAFQGAAKSVQSAFSPQAIQQPSLISLSG